MRNGSPYGNPGRCVVPIPQKLTAPKRADAILSYPSKPWQWVTSKPWYWQTTESNNHYMNISYVAQLHGTRAGTCYADCMTTSLAFKPGFKGNVCVTQWPTWLDNAYW